MDVYQIVTDKIVNMLEAGVVPWRKPWSSVGLPRNLVTKQTYRGINEPVSGLSLQIFQLTSVM